MGSVVLTHSLQPFSVQPYSAASSPDRTFHTGISSLTNPSTSSIPPPTSVVTSPGKILPVTTDFNLAAEMSSVDSNALEPSYPTPAQLYRDTPQRISHSYTVEASFIPVVFVMIRRGWLSEDTWEGTAEASMELRQVHPDIDALITNVPRLRSIDFNPLRASRYDFASQT